jgi:osmotically-inducible protein OsmY
MRANSHPMRTAHASLTGVSEFKLKFMSGKSFVKGRSTTVGDMTYQDDSMRSGQLAGFRYGDRLDEDISNYGRVSAYNTRTIPGPRHFSDRAPAPIHRGKGPRSYRRKDERIYEDICRRMADNRYLDASEVEVTVDNNNVVLTGTVSSRYEKRLAEDLSDTVYGVDNVENRLRIKEGR